MTNSRKGNQLASQAATFRDNSNDHSDGFMYNGDDMPEDFYQVLEDDSSALLKENKELRTELSEVKEASKNALLPGDQPGIFTYHGFTLTPIGIGQMPEDVSLDALKAVGRVLGQLESSIAWNVGDWARVLYHKFGVSYEDMASEFGYEVETLYTYASACGKIRTSIRNRGLSFGHHRLIVSMKEIDQRSYLDKCNENNWTVKEFRQYIKTGSPALPEKTQDAFTERKRKFNNVFKIGMTIGQGGAVKPEKAQKTIADIKALREWLNSVERDLRAGVE